MKAFLDPAYWRSVASNPAALVGLVVDLAPIFAVAVWGWGAAPLILLYWLENVVIGVFTLPRILLSGIGRQGPKGAFGAVFNAAFFSFHYGIFCLVHGGLLLTFLTNDDGWSSGSDLGAMILKVFKGALSFGQHMDWILALIVVFQALVLVREFVLQGEWRNTTPQEEMFAPYGRVILLHIGVFVIGGALHMLGDPMSGAILLVLCRALWGLHTNMQPRQKPALAGADSPSTGQTPA